MGDTWPRLFQQVAARDAQAAEAAGWVRSGGWSYVWGTQDFVAWYEKPETQGGSGE